MTNIRKSINKDIEHKLLLEKASLWQIFRHLYKRYDTSIWLVGFWGLLAVIVWNRLG